MPLSTITRMRTKPFVHTHLNENENEATVKYENNERKITL